MILIHKTIFFSFYIFYYFWYNRKIIPIEANRNVYHVKLINKVDCLVFGDNSIKSN